MKVHSALSIAVSLMLLAPAPDARAQAAAAAPPLVTQINNGNWLSAQDAQGLVDDLFYQRAIHAYITMIPALNTMGMRDGAEAEFGKGYNVLPIWKDRMDSRAWIPTPNGDVIYSLTFLDLKEAGPLVVAAPPSVIGMFTDLFQRTITDVGAIRPDRARGGLYLLLPPDYDGAIPQGYFAFKSTTYNVMLFFRTVMGKGAAAPDPKQGGRAGRTDTDLSALCAGKGRQADAVSERQRQARQHDVSGGQRVLDQPQGVRGLRAGLGHRSRTARRAGLDRHRQGPAAPAITRLRRISSMLATVSGCL